MSATRKGGHIQERKDEEHKLTLASLELQFRPKGTQLLYLRNMHLRPIPRPSHPADIRSLEIGILILPGQGCSKARLAHGVEHPIPPNSGFIS